MKTKFNYFTIIKNQPPPPNVFVVEILRMIKKEAGVSYYSYGNIYEANPENEDNSMLFT